MTTLIEEIQQILEMLAILNQASSAWTADDVNEQNSLAEMQRHRLAQNSPPYEIFSRSYSQVSDGMYEEERISIYRCKPITVSQMDVEQ